MISETSNYSEDLMTEVEQRLRKLKEFLRREAPNIEFKYELVSNNTKTFSPIPSSNNHIITSGSAQPFGSSFSSTPIEKIQLEFKENTDDNNIKEDKKLNEYSNPVTVSLVKEDNLVTVSLVKTAMTSEDMITKTSFLHHGNTIFTTTTTPELLHSFHSMCITSFWHAISIYLNCCHLHSVHTDTDLYKGCLVHKEVFDELYRIFKQNPIIDTLLAKDGTIINPTTLSTVIKKYLGSLYQSHRLKLTTITLSIPVKKTEEDQKAELLASFNEKVKSAVQTSGQEIADFSIILIDVLLFTKSRSQKLIDFPIVMMHIRENGTMVPYQTVGLVYECTSLNGSLYITKLVRREFWSPSKTQNDYNYKYQSFDILSGNTPVVHYPNPKNNTLKIPWSFVKQENNIYNLVGVLMVHNPGQKHSEPISHTLDDCEVVRMSPNVNEIRFSDFKLLESNNPKQHNCWLEDTHMTEILEASCKKFNLLSFHHSFHHVVIRSSVFQEESMNVGTHEVSKSIWEYKNLFSVPKGYFHVAINYLDTHWVYVCFIVELKMVFYYDPDFKQETQNKVWPLLKTYIDLESKLVNTHKSWSFVTPKAFPRQKDSHNCGVFTCAAAIKLMWGVCLEQDVNEYVKSFLFPHESKDIVHYRKVFASVLSGSIESLSIEFLGKLDNKFKP